MEKITKKEFISRIAKRSGLSIDDAQRAINETFFELEDIIAAGDNISITGFGSFKPKTNPSGSMRHPKTKEIIRYPASKSLKFKLSTSLKQKLNG